METTNGSSGTPADPTDQPQAGDSQAPAADAQQPQAGSADSEGGGAEAISLDEARKLRSEANSLRKRIASYEAAEKAKADGEKSELDKANARISELTKERDQLRAARREDVLRVASANAARKLGFRNPDIAYNLLDHGAITMDDKGQPTNLDALLGEVAKANAYLVTSADFGGGPRGAAPASAPSMNELLRAAAKSG